MRQESRKQNVGIPVSAWTPAVYTEDLQEAPGFTLIQYWPLKLWEERSESPQERSLLPPS